MRKSKRERIEILTQETLTIKSVLDPWFPLLIIESCVYRRCKNMKRNPR